jgi:very-short-patch-repair endonuclease
MRGNAEAEMRGPRLTETGRARALRASQTSAEALLWRRLRNRQLNGFKFVRQEPIGPFFADFCCRAARLVVEIDGATHGTEAEVARDGRRTETLNQAGYRVLRVQNVEVYEAMGDVLETILAALEQRQHVE